MVATYVAIGKRMKKTEEKEAKKVMKVKKRPAAKSSGRMSPDAIKTRFGKLITKPACLPYPAKGGRQGHLAIASQEWCQAAVDDHDICSLKK